MTTARDLNLCHQRPVRHKRVNYHVECSTTRSVQSIDMPQAQESRRKPRHVATKWLTPSSSRWRVSDGVAHREQQGTADDEPPLPALSENHRVFCGQSSGESLIRRQVLLAPLTSRLAPQRLNFSRVKVI